MPSSTTLDLETVLSRVSGAASSNTLISLVLSDSVNRSADAVTRADLRPVLIRGELHFQLSRRIGKQEFHENITPSAVAAEVGRLFPGQLRSLLLYTAQSDLRASVNKKRELKVQESPASKAPRALDHNRQKQYLIPEGQPCPFLQALGVMNSQGQVLKTRMDKFRQINRYLEIVNDIYPELPQTGTLRVIDFGCGLSYLTFAVHHLLTAIHDRQVDILGIDRNADVISRCRLTVEQLQLSGLQFNTGEISSEQTADPRPVHLAISLHACDTATDYALAFAVRNQASVILAAPCCQHELAASLQAPSLELMTRHGILNERFAALATDALRAAALEIAGYRTQVMEFIDTSHTPKNLLIRSIRRSGLEPDVRSSRHGYDSLKAVLGVTSLTCDLIFRDSDKNQETLS